MSISFSAFNSNGHGVGNDNDYVNVGNENAGAILRELGYSIEDSYFTAPIDEFIGRCRSWLRRNIGKRSNEIEAVQDGNWIECGRREGYLNEKIMLLVLIAEAGKTQGGTKIVGV